MTPIEIKGFFAKFNQTWEIVVRVWYPIRELGLLRMDEPSFIQFTEIQWETLKRHKMEIVEHHILRDHGLFYANPNSIPATTFQSIDPDLKIVSSGISKVQYDMGRTSIVSYHPDAMIWIFEKSDEIDRAFAKIKRYETDVGEEAFLEERARVEYYINRFGLVRAMYRIRDRSMPMIVEYIQQVKNAVREMADLYATQEVVYANLLNAFYEFNWSYEMIVDMKITTVSYFRFMMSQINNWKFVKYAPYDLFSKSLHPILEYQEIEDLDEIVCLHMETIRRSIEFFLEWDYEDFTRYFISRRLEVPMDHQVPIVCNQYLVYLDISRWKELYDACIRSGFQIWVDRLVCFDRLSLFEMTHERYVVERPIQATDIDRILTFANVSIGQDDSVLVYILHIFYYIDQKRIPLGNQPELVYATIRRILKLLRPRTEWIVDPDRIQELIRAACMYLWYLRKV